MEYLPHTLAPLRWLRRDPLHREYFLRSEDNDVGYAKVTDAFLWQIDIENSSWTFQNDSGVLQIRDISEEAVLGSGRYHLNLLPLVTTTDLTLEMRDGQSYAWISPALSFGRSFEWRSKSGSRLFRFRLEPALLGNHGGTIWPQALCFDDKNWLNLLAAGWYLSIIGTASRWYRT